MCVCVLQVYVFLLKSVLNTNSFFLIVNYFQITPINMWQDLFCFSLHFLTGSHCWAQTVIEFLGNFLCQPSAAIRNHYAAVWMMSTSEYFCFHHALSWDTFVINFSNLHVSLLINIDFSICLFLFYDCLINSSKMCKPLRFFSCLIKIRLKIYCLDTVLTTCLHLW